MSVVADLHVHTTVSDGRLSLSRLPTVASAHGLRAVAVTDHDRFHLDLDEPVTVRAGVAIIHGIELRVSTPDGQRVDLLGFGLRRTEPLEALVDRLQENRIERARRIVSAIEAREGIEVDLEFEPGVGRPHIARAVANHPDTSDDYHDVFDRLIGEGKPCYVSREIPPFQRGLDVLVDACALVGLAHPLRYDDPVGAIALAADLDAIERWYPYGELVRNSLVRDAIDRFDLVPTGGSDAHDEHLGTSGIPAASFPDVYAAITGHTPEP